MIQKSRKGFSLVELSVMLAIISTIIVGVLKVSDLMDRSSLVQAQNLTIDSPVKDIENLVLWLETSLEDSFESDEAVDGTGISVWYDVNQQQSLRSDATQSTSGYKPIFYENVFNDVIPAIRFDGTDDYMSFDAKEIINSSYTIFVVEQRRSSASNNYFLGGNSNTAGTALTAGYATDTSVKITHQGTQAITATVSAYSSPTPTIHTIYFNIMSGVGKKYWTNGGSSTDASSTTQTTTLSELDNIFLGEDYGGNNYNGDLAEVIIFNRALKESEIQLIQDYLSKKYRISIS
jgi:Tfp pilus assembly major pilin PilA